VRKTLTFTLKDLLRDGAKAAAPDVGFPEMFAPDQSLTAVHKLSSNMASISRLAASTNGEERTVLNGRNKPEKFVSTG